MEKTPLIGALLTLLGMPVPSHAALPQRDTKSMSFEACLAAKDQAIASSGAASPEDIIPIVENSELTITQICTAEGVVLITCMKDNHQMVTTQAPLSANSGCLD